MKPLILFSILCMVLLTSVSMVSAVPPFQTNTNTQDGLQIFYPPFEAIKYNQSFSLHVHISNLSNGVPFPNTDVDCYLHLYNSQGNHLIESPTFAKDGNGWDLEYELGAGNFTEEGERNVFYIWCNNTAQNLGGQAKGTYEITANGKPTPDGIIILGFVLMLIIIFMFSAVYLVRAIGLIIDANFDILDIAYAWGLFFGLLGVNLLAKIYLGSLVILDFLSLFIKILAFPFILFPIIVFLLSLFRQNKKQKKKGAEW